MRSSERPPIQHIVTGQAANMNSVPTGPSVIEDCDAGFPNEGDIFITEEGFMVSKAHEGRRDIDAASQQRQDFFLRFYKQPGFRRARIDQIASDADD